MMIIKWQALCDWLVRCGNTVSTQSLICIITITITIHHIAQHMSLVPYLLPPAAAGAS